MESSDREMLRKMATKEISIWQLVVEMLDDLDELVSFDKEALEKANEAEREEKKPESKKETEAEAKKEFDKTVPPMDPEPDYEALAQRARELLVAFGKEHGKAAVVDLMQDKWDARLFKEIKKEDYKSVIKELGNG